MITERHLMTSNADWQNRQERRKFFTEGKERAVFRVARHEA